MRRIVMIVGLVAIMVVAGYGVNVFVNIRAKARTSNLDGNVENLFLALQQFKENLGHYPVGSGNADIAKALKGGNPKNVIILVGKKAPMNDKGEFVDPWGTPLRIYFTENSVMIRSAGPNKRFDDSTNIECDDYYRSN